MAINQQFHVVMKGREVKVRRPLPPGVKYDSKEYIHPDHEVRQFLEPLGTFAMASIEDVDKASYILDHGYIEAESKTEWHVAGGYIRDDGAVFCLLPERVTDAEFFKRLGMRVDLPKRTDSFKVGKYIKRLWSHHRRYVQGDVIEEQGDVLIVRLDNGKIISVRYAPKSPLTEGMNLVSTKCLKMLGYNGEHGTGLRVTALSPRGFTKGHAIALEQLHYDLVMYETKELLKSNGRFTFALDELHPGKLYTDPQSVINFQLYNGPFLESWAETFMRQVIEALKDEEKLRNMLRFYNINFHRWERDDPKVGAVAGEYIFKEKDWALLRALRSGIGIVDTPGLIRKVFHLFVDKVMDCEDNVRIPVQPDKGGARYILIDPTIFDMWGNPSLDGVLRGNEVFCPGHIGPVAFHRQPNAHRMEHHIADSVHHAEHVAMDTGSFLFISKDAVVPVLKKLGGGDQDDRVVYYTDPEVVTHFSNLSPYPIEQVPVRVEPERARNRFIGDILKATYNRHILKVILANQSQQRVSIGQAVNPIMVDTLISDQRDNIINYLVNDAEQTTKVMSALVAMRGFEGYKMRKVASQLESIIDAVKRDGADVTVVANEIRAFWDWLPVVDESMLEGGKYGGRLPNSRRGDSLPVIVRTQLAEVLSNIAQARTELEDYLAEYTWEVAANRSMPEEIQTYPDAIGDIQLAYAIRTFYHQTRERIMAPISEAQPKARIAAFLEVDKTVYDRFKDHPVIEHGMLKLYRMIYSKIQLNAPLDSEGRPRPYPDGLLWGPYMSGLTIKALDRAELTGRYVDVTFYDDRKRYRRGTYDVLIQEGIVNVGPDNQVGMVDPIADRQTKMEGGLIKVPTQAVAPVETPNVVVATVVAGWRSRADTTPEKIREWKSHVMDKVQLVPYVYTDEKTGEASHAVRVLLENGEEYGKISAREADRVIVPTVGWLAPPDNPHSNTMRVQFKA